MAKYHSACHNRHKAKRAKLRAMDDIKAYRERQKQAYGERLWENGEAFRFTCVDFLDDDEVSDVGWTEEDSRVVLVTDWDKHDGISFSPEDARKLAKVLLLAALEAEQHRKETE